MNVKQKEFVRGKKLKRVSQSRWLLINRHLLVANMTLRLFGLEPDTFKDSSERAGF